ncbi:MAG: hypothetical protein E7452_07525 [Ruminococcaceae bacterium]|nr:hypothetical protein [Oscillospiraceae bacterium]
MTKTVILRRLLLLLLSVLLLLPLAACGESPQNVRYTPVKVVYLHPERDSPVWQDDTGNPFHLWEYQWNSDGQFFLRFISKWDGPQMWEPVGRVEKATVDATLFANAFRSDTVFDPAELLAENRAAYAIPSRVRVENEEVFGNYLNYYLLEQANGEVYLVEWMDAPYYSPERADDTMIVLTVALLETADMDEPITEYTEDGGHLAAQTTKFATSIGNGVLWDRSSGLFYGDAVYQWIDAPLEIGSEIRYTYTGLMQQTSPARISQILYAEKTLSPSAAIPIPEQLNAQASVAWEWANTMTLVLPEGILPETPEAIVYAPCYPLRTTGSFALGDVRLTTTGVAYRYDRADGTTEYWIEVTDIQPIH